MKVFKPLTNCRKTALAFLAVLFCLMMKSEVGLGQTTTYTTPGTYTFTVPIGVSSITVSTWGGGGAGGGVNSQTKGGGGGEGGSFVRGTIAVTPGSTYTIVVGSGGAGANTANGGSGAASSFSVSGGGATLFNAIGGVGGNAGTNASNFGAGGNAANSGNIVSGSTTSNFYGGNGGTATNTSSASSGGGGGSAGAGSGGGNGGSPLTAGTAGTGSGVPADAGVAGTAGRGSANDGNGLDAGSPGGGGSGGRVANPGGPFRGGNGGNGQVNLNYTQLTYKSQINSISFGSTNWCVGETRSVTVSITNIGTATWTDASPDINIGLKWDSDPDYGSAPGNIGRQNAGGLAPGATATYTFPVVTPVIASGTDHLNVDVVYEGVAWFRQNSPTGIGPGNPSVAGGTAQYASSAITIVALPSAAGTITGTTPVCQGQNTVSYTVPAIANSTSYTWAYSGTGATITGTGNTVTISYSTTATSGILTVKGTNSCGSGTVSANYPITVNPLPVAAGTITGTTPVCQGQNTVSYTVPAITNATSYIWAYSGTGATITGTGNTVTISYSTTATSGILTVKGTNSCGSGTVSANYQITVNPLPVAAGTITGTTPVCQGQNTVSYTVPAIANSTSYTWAYSGTGATITGTGNTVTINYSTTATSGILTVKGTNSCGSGTVSANYPITVNPLPVAAGTITGTTPVCQGQNTVSYTVPAITNATSYIWAYSGTGATITGTGNTVTISFSTIATSGNLTIMGNNSCGNGTISAAYPITVNPLPVAAGTITGTTPVCQGQNTVFYTVPAITNATSYIWAYSGTGATITGTGNTVTISFSTTATSGNLTVMGNNSCGNGTISAAYPITVNPLPVAAGTITGTTPVCQGQNTVSYTVPAITNATSYTWAYSGTGATITGTGNSITIDFSATATSGNLTVTGVNSCGNGTISANYAIIVNQPPVITGDLNTTPQTVCASSNVTYTITATGSGLTYQWLKNGSNISGATTATLTLTNVTISDNGSYSVKVSGLSPCGSVTSASAVLIVDQRIVYSVQPVTPQTICEGQPYTISATATGTIATAKWFKGGVYYADATVSGNVYSLTISAVAPGDAGQYQLTLDDGTGIGCTAANSNAAILVVNPTPTATISGTTTVCQSSSPAPLITFTNPNALPVTITYNINLGANLTINVAANSTTTVAAPTGTAGTFDYNLVSVAYQSGPGCINSITGTATVIVNPTPDVTATPSSQPVCSGTAITTIALTGSVTGTTFAWTRDNTASVTGIAASGNGDISGTLTNSTNAPITVTFTITPTANTCVGTAITATVTVNPIPTFSSTLTPPARCSNTSGTYTATSPTTGITFSWARAAVTGISNAAGSGSGATITETLINTTTDPVNVIYVITLTANGCSSTQNVTVTVNPTPVLSSNLTPPARCSNISATYTATSATTGTTYTWTRAVVAGISNAAGSGNTAAITETLINTTANPVNVVYAIILTANSCSNTQNVTVTVNPTPVLNSSLTPPAICNNTVFSYSPTSATSGTTFDWSRAVVAGISNAAATGTNNPNETLINTTANPINVIYVYTLTANGCTNTQNVAVSVKPTPVLSSSLTPPARCSNVSTTYTATSATGSTTYTWTRAAVIGITPNTGSGGSAAITETLVNTTANPITVTYVIVLTANGCSNTQNVTAVVNPSPTLSSSLTPPAICNNTVFSYTPTSATTGVTFNWSRATVVGISNAAASGTNNPNETLINTTTAPVSVTYVYTLSANGCSSNQNVVVVVNPSPTLSSSLTPPSICNNTVFSYNPTSATSGTTFDWSRAVVAGISNAAATGTNNPNETLINTTANPINVIYVYTLTANGCTNTQNVTVSVKPTPVLSSSLTPPARCSNVSTTYTATSATTGTTYTWTRAVVAGISNAAGSGGSATITETLINTTANPITVTYVIVLTANGCSNTQNVTAVVNPSPTLSSSLTPPAICNNTVFSYTPTSATTGVTFNWSRATVVGISNAAASGTNNPNETLINTTTAPVSVTYVYTLSANGCSSNQNVVVVVNPTPVLNSSLTPPARCNNTSGTYTATSATSGTTYTWTRAAVTGISNAAGSGSGAAITETLVNTTTDPVSVVYVITLTANGCTNTQNVTVVINPTPVLTSSLTAPARCSNVSTTYTITSATTPFTVTWSRAAVAGITPNTGAGGSASIIETLVNSTANPITVTYVIVLTANGCSNTQNVTAVVNPSPTLSSSLTQNRCDNVSSTYTATSATTGTTFSWSRAAVAGISNATASGSGAVITETLDNTTANPINIIYAITLSANGCSNTQNVTVTVNPTPVLSSTLTPPARCSNTAGTYTATSATTAATYTWSRAAVAGISNAAASGSGATITETLINTTTSPVNVIYAITLTINGCTNTQNVTLTINPLPTITPAATAASKCFSSSAQTTTLAYSNATASPTTYSINYNAAANTAGFVDVTDALLPATPIIINIAAGTAPGTYTGSITVKNANGCTSGSASSFTVTINALPIPSLTNSPASPVCANTNVTYTTDASQTSYVWTFSGIAGTDYTIVSGGNSTSNTAAIKWLTAGTKTVTVNYNNGNGCTAVTPTSNTIIVDALPAGTFTAVETSGTANNDGIICAGDPVTFTFSNATYGSYIFKVNGTVKQTGTSNTYSTSTLVNGDIVTVDVANASNCGATFGPITITVNPLPTPTLVANKAAICPGDNVTFTATPTGTGFIYNFKLNGSSVQSGSSNTYSTTSLITGNSVTVDLTNANGCTATSAAVSVTVNALPSGSLSATENSGTPNDNKICAGSNVTFTATSGFSNYNFKVNGTSVQNGASNTYSSSTLTNGSIVTVDVTNASTCTATFGPAQVITVFAIPTGSLTATETSGTPNDNTICAGANVKFTATSGYSNYKFYLNGTGAAVQSGVSNVYNTTTLISGDYITVVVTNGNGCTATFTSPIITVVAIPTGTLTASANPICAGDQVDFTATTGFANYNFKRNGLSFQNGSSNTASYTGFVNGDVVTVDVSNAQTCLATFNPITINVNPLPAGTFTPVETSGNTNNDGIICAGANVDFTTTAGFSNYNFMLNGVTVQYSAANIYSNNTLVDGDVVTVEVTNASGCINTFNTVTISVKANPIVQPITGTSTVCISSVINLSDATASGVWSSSNNLIATVDASGNVTGVAAGTVTISYSVTNANGCNTTVTKIITVKALPTVAPITGNFNVCTNTYTQLDDITPGGTWSTSDNTVATVDVNGLVEGISQGTATISYTVTGANGCTTTVTANVTVALSPTVAPITTTAPSFDVCVGSSITLKDVTTGGTWSSSDNTIATVSASGVVTGVGAGPVDISYTITTTCNSIVAATQTVTVHALPTATISGTATVCLNSAPSPNITFTGANGTAPYTFTYNINGGSNQIVTTASGNSVTVSVPTGTAGAFTYNLISVKDGGSTSCSQNQTGSATITVNALPTATISGTTSVCIGSTSPVITFTGSGGTAPYTFSYNINGGSTLTVISVGNIATVPVSTAAAGTFTYNLLSVQEGSTTSCSGIATGSATVTVTPASVGGTVTPSVATVCSGSNTGTLTLSGHTGNVIRWEFSVNGGTTWTSVANTTTSLTYTNLTQTTLYRAVVQSGSCSSSNSVAATITVNPVSVGGTVASNATVCSGSNSGTLTLSGNTGSVVRWEFSVNGGTTWTTIANTTNSQTYTNLTQTTLYRAVVQSGVCASANSAAATITVNPLPTATISGTASVCQNAAAPSITFTGANGTAPYIFTYKINAGGNLTVSSGAGNTATVTQSTATVNTYIYTLVSVSSATTCSQNQSGTATITVNAPPAAFILTPSSATICQGAIQPLSASANTSTTGSVTFNSTTNNIAIPDLGSISNSITVSGVPAGAVINGVSVNFNITHTADGDLILNLKAPNGNVLNLVDERGGAGNNFTNTIINSTSVNPISAGSATFTNTYSPDAQNNVGNPNASNVAAFSSLYSIPNGNWVFESSDEVLFRGFFQTNTGTFNNWSITINYTIPNSALPVTWSPTTDLYTDAGATTAYSGTSLSTVYAKPSTSGTKIYTATATNAANCTTSQNVTLTVNPTPVVTITADYCAVAGKVQLTANSVPAASSYLWSTGQTTNPILVDVAGNYTVTVISALSCPGTATISVANELVVNGDFSAGNVGFTSPPLGSNQYQYRADIAGNNELVPEGLYGVGTDAQNYHPNFWGHDHTTGSGNYMIVNGFPNGNPQPIVWQETVNVLPNTTYYFSAWGISVNNVSPFAQLQFNLNGAQVGSVATLTAGVNNNTNNGWTRFYGTFTTGPTITTAVISITDLQNAVGGNDFGLDDISFGTLSTFINLESAPGTDAQTPCINTAITPIVYSVGTSATAPTVTGLPPGVTASFNGELETISGTPTVAGNYSYTITTTGSCQPSTATGTINVQKQIITLTSGNASPTLCINTTLNPSIVYTVSGSGTGAGVTGLPTGMSGTYNPGTKTFTIFGTPTVAGVFNFTVTTTGTCTAATATGTITVQSQTITLNAGSSATQTVCINNPISSISYTLGATTGATITGLPSGVSGLYSSGSYIISGTPTVSGTFNYTVTTSGTCSPAAVATGTITVNADASITLSSAAGTDNQTVCNNTAIININYVIGASGNNATITSGTLPAGVTGNYNSGTKIFTISGTPTVIGTFNYTITATGGCGSNDISGTITVQTSTITLSSGTASQTVCLGSSLTNIVFITGGGVTGASIIWTPSIPPGISNVYLAGSYTISGSPTVLGSFNYTITTSGGCAPDASVSGTITVNNGTVGGTLPALVSICSGGGGVLNLTGQTGTVQRWEKSTDGGITWTNIANTTTTLAYSGIVVPTQYRALVKSGSCNALYSTIALIGIHNYWTGATSTNWSVASNWSDNQMPSFASCNTVIIPFGSSNPPQLTSNVIIPNLNIAPGISLKPEWFLLWKLMVRSPEAIQVI